MNIFETLGEYFRYEFVWNALIVGVLVAICAAVFGVVLVLKRFSFIGDGLSHVAFGALAVAAVIGITDNMLIVLPVTVLAAILLLRSGQRTKIKGDSAIAMLSAGALAVGYILMSVFSASANVAGDVCSSLFGSFSIITLSRTEVILCICLSLVVLAVFVLLYNKIFAVTFDEQFAKAGGVAVGMYNLILAVITAVIIVLAMKLVGSLLISALLIFPVISAMQIAKSFKGTVVLSASVSALSAIVGILLSLLLSTPVGPTVVAVNILAFAVCFVIGKIRR